MHDLKIFLDCDLEKYESLEELGHPLYSLLDSNESMLVVLPYFGEGIDCLGIMCLNGSSIECEGVDIGAWNVCS
jgi:hypothetical protein